MPININATKWVKKYMEADFLQELEEAGVRRGKLNTFLSTLYESFIIRNTIQLQMGAKGEGGHHGGSEGAEEVGKGDCEDWHGEIF